VPDLGINLSGNGTGAGAVGTDAEASSWSYFSFGSAEPVEKFDYSQFDLKELGKDTKAKIQILKNDLSK